MDNYFAPLLEEIKTYIHNVDTQEKIKNAYVFAYNAHNGQKRASQEAYIIHPVSVALTLCQYKADPTTIIAALLHDVIEDTKYTYEDIKELFGTEVSNLVEGLTKIKSITYDSQSQGNLENNYDLNYQKMLISMSKDIRVIWIKLADRLNNMKTLKYLPFEKQIRISKETLAIYSPIAHKLGMYHIKAELEDLSFKYLYPNDYMDISKKIKFTKKSREKDVEMMLSNLKTLLEAENIKCEISGRAKNIYSIYNKMNVKGIPFENIYDLLALRIIVDSVMDCYKTIGIVHSKYSPVPSRFKDYIAMPKPNMYQSLHTSVISEGKIYEIQIRTKEMDEIAENGIAAHWVYKEGSQQKKNYYEATAISKLRWYNDLLKFTDENNNEKTDVTTLFSEEVLHANVYVFTPKNTVISLPEGATVIDFAYRIHSRVGDTFTGAIVNSKMVPIDYQLKTGDVCEIKTSSNAFGPNDNWLKIAKTSSARNKIKQFLNNKNRSILIEDGKALLNQEIKSQKLDINLTDELVEEKLSEDKGIHSLDELYYLIAKGNYSPQGILQSFKVDDRSNNDRIIDLVNERNKNQVFHEDVDIIVEGLDTPSVKLSKCCSPIPGDEIIGYITKGVGIAVHRECCRNAQSFDQNRLISVYWSNKIDRRFSVDLKIYINNRDNILADILNSCTSNNAKVIKVSARTDSIGQGIVSLIVQVYTKHDLDVVILNLQKIKGIYTIERVLK